MFAGCHGDMGLRERDGGSSRGGASVKDVQVVGLDDSRFNLPEGNLTCHHCYLSTHGPTCMDKDPNFSTWEVEKCNIKQKYCMVRHLLDISCLRLNVQYTILKSAL